MFGMNMMNMMGNMMHSMMGGMGPMGEDRFDMMGGNASMMGGRSFPRGQRRGPARLRDSVGPATWNGDGEGAGGPCSMLQMMGGGACSSFSSTVCYSSTVASDGQVHTRHYSSSTVADGSRGIRETKRAFSDSREGVEKIALERQINDQGRKVVMERNAEGQSQTEILRNINEDEVEHFDERWQRDAAPYLPAHQVQTRALLGDSHGGSNHRVTRPHSALADRAEVQVLRSPRRGSREESYGRATQDRDSGRRMRHRGEPY